MAQDRLRPGEDAKLERYLERAQRAGQRARDLIQQMLTFSRGQRGEPRPLALAPLIEESVKLLGSTLPSSMELHTSVAREVPLVCLDPIQVEQVLMNLCINARDAMAGSGFVEVGLRHAEHHGAICASCRKPVEGPFVEIAVRDTGPGLPPEHLDRVFEPFFTTKEVGKGSGMGLAMVHGIVHEYDGHILVDTAPGAGATFRVLFRPLETAGTSGEYETDPAAASTKGGPVLQGRVLLVDDDEVAGGFMQDLLEEWGLTVAAFRDATQARGHFAQHPEVFDLAILDQTMPRMTGFELAGQMLAIRPDFPIVLYTGYSETLSEERIIDAGIRALVRKPVDTDALCTLLKDLLAEQAS
jgi:CheY-like chemotaxis protein